MGLYHCPLLQKSDIHERFKHWIALTLDPHLRCQVTFFRYAPALNKSTKDMYPNLIGELNPKDQHNRWENLSNLSNTPQSLGMAMVILFLRVG